MWLVAFESMTHLEEEDIRHVLGLPNSASIVMRIEANFNDSWYWQNLAYLFAKTTTNFSEAPLADTTWAS